jgi:hypothetical protein
MKQGRKRIDPLFTYGGNVELVAELNKQAVRFIIVGGVAVRFYSRNRQQEEDLDILIESSPQNAERVFEALKFLPLRLNFTKADISAPGKRPQQLKLKDHSYPCHADILTAAPDVEFGIEWEQAQDGFIERYPVRFASPQLLIRMKSGGNQRQKDRQDVDALKRYLKDAKS